ncbi:peroxisome biogenesis factor 13 isoform X1 [Pundamilia nyererei]|uniref:Peroxisomal membrane protein PEX13 n=1 Tax=Pundamilia nyererei TaxID=303518 RepID=A0A3B4FG80_9CICH|nr:PREDICTED: peroxisome biogenesis factor 13 isoform X1 [Pundamilia nyererei]
MDSQPPTRPWERRIPGSVGAPLNYRSTDLGLARGSSTSAGPSVLPRMVPPVPPRQVQQSYRPSYSSFSQSYSPYGSSIYGGYSPYSYGYGGGYGSGYGGGYSLGGYRHTPHLEDVPPSRFVQQAEESSRGAFESIESIVHAFASISMMMDATFSALHNGFRAVLEVVNHVTRLRVHLTRVLSKFALVRTLHYLYRLVQKLLGRRLDPEVEALWPNPSEATGMRSSREMEDQAVKSWPILMFFALVLGVPYLIWKLSSTADSEIKDTNWASGEDDHVVARAEYDFTAASQEELSMQAGEMLNLAPKELQPRVRGWLLASVDGETTGLIPANYVKILGKRRGRRAADMERLAQAQRANTQEPQTSLAAQMQTTGAQGLDPASASASASSSALASSEDLLESAYRETPASFNQGSSTSTMPSNTPLNIPEKTDP